jgi:hypothetical protein
MKIDNKLVAWIETTLDRLCAEGFGDICLTWHVRNGKVEWISKKVEQTEKDTCR